MGENDERNVLNKERKLTDAVPRRQFWKEALATRQ